MNEYDAAVAASLQPDPAQAARIGFAAAADTNPDAYAEAQRVARRTGVPVATVENMPAEMKRQDAIGSIDFATLARTSPSTAALLADVERAKIAHDNVDSLSRIEETLRPITRGVRAAAAGVSFDLSSGFYGLIETGLKMAAPLADPLAGTLLPENPLRRVAAGYEEWRKQQAAWAEKVAGDQAGAGFVEQGVTSGFRSFGQMLPGLFATVTTGNPAFALGSAGALQGSQSATKALDAGRNPWHAALYGAEDAAAEVTTEMLPMGRLLKDLKAGAPFFKVLAHQIATEVPTELAATAWQNFNEWANLHPDKPFSSYLEALPAAEAQTVIATITTSVLTAGMGKGVHAVVNRMQQRREEASRADQTTAMLDSLNQLAAADKLLARDPQTFEQFVAQAAEGGPVPQVFIDARTLLQSGIAGEVAAVSPAVAGQLEEAARSGGQIAIPIEEYAARIAPTEYAAGLLDHLKTDPEGFSRAEAQAYLQSHSDELRQEVERMLVEKAGDDSFKQSAEAVRAGIRTQLDTAARFTPQVNDAYAAMVGNFYAVTAAKLGTTPEALFQRYPLQIGAENIAGQEADAAYNQSRKGKRDDYTIDLFGVPDDTRADTSASGSAAGRQSGQLSRDDAPGTYAARTELVTENTRQLGTDRVSAPHEAAQALAYLANSAVERFDALVTDKDGKPLAVVGAFKGALSQTSVYPATLAAEAFRVKGAANIWFAHNHPSGTNELSDADRRLHATLAEVFRGSEIKAHGIFAIAGKEGDGRQWVFEPTSEGRYNTSPDERGVSAAPTATASVPVVERVYSAEGRLGPSVTAPSIAKTLAKNLSGGHAGVILMTAQNEPVAFVPVDASKAGTLRHGGRMDALYRALSVSNAGAAILVNDGSLGDAVVQNLAGLFNSLEARVIDVMDISGETVRSWAEEGKQFNDRAFNQGARGAFNPASLSITLLKGADLSTFLHESGHFFLEVMADLAQRPDAPASVRADFNTLLGWFGVEDAAAWYGLGFEEKRAYHEQFARGFEAYLFEGKAPSIEMQSLFQRFRAWLLAVYRELKALNVELSDEVRGVFDRMLASNDEIALAEQGRSMMPLFTSPEQAGMTPEEFAAYQALGTEATAEAIEDLQARGLRDMRWLHNARGRLVKQLQKEAAAQRAEVQIEVRREVMRQPVYRAWQFLTGKLNEQDKAASAPAQRPKSNPNSVDASQDSLFVAIAKLGGIRRDLLESEWGLDPKERSPQPVFGKPVIRRTDGLTLDGMAEALSEYGYLTLDENGKWDLRELEEKFFDELGGSPHYSNAVDPSIFQDQRPGDGVTAENAGAGRLDITALKTLGIPDEIVEHVKNLKMTARDGIHPDIVAEMFGFTSGDELVRTLAAAQSPKVEIEGLTDMRMLERYGDLSSPAAIERAADKAIHNDARARFVATEANALAKATGQRKVLASAAKGYARAMIDRLKVRAIRPGQYASAEVRAAKAAEKASKAGDLATAAAEKRNQLVQNYATRAAYDAQDEIAKGLRYLKKFEGDVKGLDADYADQIGALLERFDLRKGQTLKAIDKRAALAEWITAQREAGLEPDIPLELQNEAFRKSYRDMTVEEFRGLVETVKQIEHLGRLKHTLLTARDQRAYEAVRDEIAGSIRANAQGRQADTRTPTTNMGRAVQGLKRFWASHIKAATWARVMDGGKDGGPVWEYFVRNANERGDRETTMRAEATTRLSEILAPVFAQGRMGGKGQYFPSIRRSLNREARLAVALNIGNEGNLQRLLGGEGWTEAQLLPVLQTLTPEEKAAVQAVWDHFESYRPQIAAKERRIYGKEPEWVEPGSRLTVALGLRGGYYPIKYDPAASQRAEEHSDAEAAKRQLQGAYTTATTRRSFTKARVDEVTGRPLLYTLSGLYSGVNDVIHDLAWHEWLIDANRLLRSHTIDAAIREHYGPEVKQQLKSWAADIAEGEKGADAAVDLALSRLRQGVSAAGLGFNVMSALIQPLGITQSITRIGAEWTGRGVMKYLAHPVELTREVNGKSDFMANRARTRFRELNELRNQVQDQSAFKEITGRYAYFLMMRCQQMVDVPTWWGAYEKAIAEGNDEERATALADQAVIDAQGGGQTKDLSAIERGGPAQKLFTVFYSFMNTELNLGAAQTMTADTPAKKAKLAADYALLYVVPAVLGFFLKAALTPGDAGDDDLEKLAKKLLASQIDYLMGLMVVAREFGEAAKTMAGANDLGRDYTGPAGLRLVADSVALAKQAHQGEFDDAFRKAAVNVVGDLFGLPSAQVNRSVTGANALVEGKTNNPAALVFGFQEKR